MVSSYSLKINFHLEVRTAFIFGAFGG
ncbi:uncharacterized protein METZ01_LOCUS276234, partial [marine metagenome]